MLKKALGTIITLAYDSSKKEKSSSDLASLIKSVENKVTNKEGLKIYVSSDFRKGNVVHHNILINKEVDISVESECGNGSASVEYIKDADHYKRVLEYMMH